MGSVEAKGTGGSRGLARVSGCGTRGLRSTCRDVSLGRLIILVARDVVYYYYCVSATTEVRSTEHGAHCNGWSISLRSL